VEERSNINEDKLENLKPDFCMQEVGTGVLRGAVVPGFPFGGEKNSTNI